jgi:hypothetical protein
MQWARNKRGMTLNPRTAGARDLAPADPHSRCRRCESPTGHLVDGLDYPTLAAIKPDIILTTTTAFGGQVLMRNASASTASRRQCPATCI